MSELLTRALRQATASTFEKLAMLIADSAPPASGWPGTVRTTSITLRGGTTGYFELDVAQSLLPEVAEGMLGVSATDAQTEIDVLGELANVICGNLLAALPSDVTTHLSPPVVVAAPASGIPVARAAFSVERRAVEARLFLASGAR